MSLEDKLFHVQGDGKVEDLKTLLDQGVDINYVSIGSTWGWTPLMYAVSRNNVEQTKLLVDKGADLLLKSKEGDTALSMASQGNKPEISRHLVNALIFTSITAIDAEPESWGVIPSATSPFQRPSAWSVAAPLVEVLKFKGLEARGPITKPNLEAEALPLAQQMFAKVVPLIAASEEAQRALLAIFEERKRGSLTQYRAILTRTRRDPTFPEFTRVSSRLQQKLAARRGECVQQRPRRGGALDFFELRSQANTVKSRFDAFLRALATKCAAESTTAPLKGAWRAIEKMALRVESAGERCGALKDGPLDAAPLCDVLRGSLKCKDFVVLLTAFELLENLDADFGDLSQARGLTQRIRLLRIKDRFSAPTSGGWADVLVNFVFEDDDTKHVVELQLQHESMLLVRKEGGGHQDYNEFRSAFELLEAVGKEPHDAFEDAELDAEPDASTAATQARSDEVAALQKKVNSLEERLAAQEKQMAEMQAVLTRLVKTDAIANRPETLVEPGKLRASVGGGSTSRPGSGSMTKPKEM